VRHALPTWWLLRWRPHDEPTRRPTDAHLRGRRVVLFVDDLQHFVAGAPNLPEGLAGLAGGDLAAPAVPAVPLVPSGIETHAAHLQALLEEVRAIARDVVVVATCRTEGEGAARAALGDVFARAAILRMPHFSADPRDPAAAAIIAAFARAGAATRATGMAPWARSSSASARSTANTWRSPRRRRGPSCAP
jgi:hypothetical protein